MTDRADVMTPAYGVRGLGQAMRGIARAATLVSTELARQSDRAFLWAVAAFALGVVLFFAWSVDPPWWSGLGIAVIGLAFLRAGRWTIARMIAFALIAVGLGHSAAQFKAWDVDAPLLDHEVGPFHLSARVSDAEKRPEGNHVIVEDFVLPGVDPARTPRRIRITIPSGHGLPAVGQRIGVRAVVRPTARSVMPDAFQFQRFLYFEGVGGTGFVEGRWQPETEAGPVSWSARFHVWTEGVRRRIGDRIMEVVPGDDGTVTAALVDGEQSAIPQSMQEAYRVAGIAHLLSISGVHLSLLAGLIFFIMRRGLALFPAIALRIDTKKVAAWTALAATAFYLIISGMSVPAVRSFLMVAMIFVAILLDRTALSLRSIAWAALILLVLFPDAIVGASFQMSFLAVLSLIALYEQAWLRVVWRTPDGRYQIFRAAAFYVAGLAVTDIVAGGATSLFAAYHFNRLPTYSMAANFIAVPVMGFWIMPFGLIATVLMPFGWDHFAFAAMGWGVTLVDDVARTIATWPGAQVHMPPMDVRALALAAAGAVFACLWRGRGRWIGLAPVAFAFAQPWLVPQPDALIDDSARVFAVLDTNGHLVARSGRAGKFVKEVWTDRYWASKDTWPTSGELNAGLGLGCDAGGCVLNRNGRHLLIGFNADAVAEDCGQVDAIITGLATHDLCRSGKIVDLFDAKRNGAYAVWLRPEGVRVRSVADLLGRRVWNGGTNTAAEDPPDDPEP